MIKVTRFNHSPLIVNAELIEFIEALPDTHITLVTGKKLLVCETPDEIIERIIEYRRSAGPLYTRPLHPECTPTEESE